MSLSGPDVTRPDLSSVLPDAEPAREKLLEVGSYMRALGLETSEINSLTVAHRKPGDVVITGGILVKIVSEAERVGEHKRRSKRRDHPGQTTLFSSTPPSDPAELVDRVAAQFAINVAADVVTEQVIEKIGPAVVKIKNQADATDARLEAVAGELKEIKAKLEMTEAKAEAPVAQDPPKPSPPDKSREKSHKSRKGRGRAPYLGGKGESVFHGPLEDELLAAFLKSFDNGLRGDVPLKAIERIAKTHNYGATTNTLLDMVKRHVGMVRWRREGGISYWSITREDLDRSLARRVLERAAATQTPPQAAPAAGQLPAQKPKKPKSRRRRWTQKEWEDDRVVKTPQVLLRFPQVSQAQLYRWVDEGKIPCQKREAGEHYYFRAITVAKAIRRLLKDSAQ